MSKPSIPASLKRILLVGRVYPSTMKYLESFGCPNTGRAVDMLAQSHSSIMRALKPELKAELDQPAPLPLAKSR